jgi:hypothetical protein
MTGSFDDTATVDLAHAGSLCFNTLASSSARHFTRRLRLPSVCNRPPQLQRSRSAVQPEPPRASKFSEAFYNPLWQAGTAGPRPKKGTGGKVPMPREFEKVSKRGRKPFHESMNQICFDDLTADAHSLLGKSYTLASKRSIATAMRAWYTFIADYTQSRPQMLRMPTFHGDLTASMHNELSLMLFVVWCWRGGLAPSSAATYTSLVRNQLGTSFGWKLTCKDAEMRLPRLLRALRRTENRVRKKRLGFRAHHHRKLLRAGKAPTSLREVTAHAMIATSRVGLMRGADMLPQTAGAYSADDDLCIGDVSFPTSPEPHMVIMCKPAKKAAGVEKVPVLFPRSDAPTSPYVLIDRMLAMRRAEVAGRGTTLEANAPLFTDSSKSLSTSLAVSDLRCIFKNAAKAIGLDPKHFGAHSGRIGGATDHFAGGTPAIVIQICGRWDSDIWQIYARQCVGQTLHHAKQAEANEDMDLEEAMPDYAQPARVTRAR